LEQSKETLVWYNSKLSNETDFKVKTSRKRLIKRILTIAHLQTWDSNKENLSTSKWHLFILFFIALTVISSKMISKEVRLKHDKRINFQIQLRQSILIVLICYDVDVHEKTRGENCIQTLTRHSRIHYTDCWIV